MALGTLDGRPPAPNPGFKPTSAQAQGYAARKVAATQAQAATAVSFIEGFSAVAREVVGVAKSNPIMGIFLAIVGADMLERAGLITNQAKVFIFTVCGVAFGVEVSLELIEGVGSVISSIDPFSAKGSAAPDPSKLIAPSATTIVENPPVKEGSAGAMGGAGGAGALAALIPKALPAVT